MPVLPALSRHGHSHGDHGKESHRNDLHSPRFIAGVRGHHGGEHAAMDHAPVEGELYNPLGRGKVVGAFHSHNAGLQGQPHPHIDTAHVPEHGPHHHVGQSKRFASALGIRPHHEDPMEYADDEKWHTELAKRSDGPLTTAGAAFLHLYAGSLGRVTGPLATRLPTFLVVVEVEPHSTLRMPIPTAFDDVLVVVIGGSGRIGGSDPHKLDEADALERHEMDYHVDGPSYTMANRERRLREQRSRHFTKKVHRQRDPSLHGETDELDSHPHAAGKHVHDVHEQHFADKREELRARKLHASHVGSVSVHDGDVVVLEPSERSDLANDDRVRLHHPGRNDSWPPHAPPLRHWDATHFHNVDDLWIVTGGRRLVLAVAAVEPAQSAEVSPLDDEARRWRGLVAPAPYAGVSTADALSMYRQGLLMPASISEAVRRRAVDLDLEEKLADDTGRDKAAHRALERRAAEDEKEAEALGISAQESLEALPLHSHLRHRFLVRQVAAAADHSHAHQASIGEHGAHAQLDALHRHDLVQHHEHHPEHPSQEYFDPFTGELDESHPDLQGNPELLRRMRSMPTPPPHPDYVRTAHGGPNAAGARDEL